MCSKSHIFYVQGLNLLCLPSPSQDPVLILCMSHGNHSLCFESYGTIYKDELLSVSSKAQEEDQGAS